MHLTRECNVWININTLNIAFFFQTLGFILRPKSLSILFKWNEFNCQFYLNTIAVFVYDLCLWIVSCKFLLGSKFRINYDSEQGITRLCRNFLLGLASSDFECSFTHNSLNEPTSRPLLWMLCEFQNASFLIYKAYYMTSKNDVKSVIRKHHVLCKFVSNMGQQQRCLSAVG